MPGSWQWRSTLQNVLRVAWMDVFERAGWSVVSMWNCNTCASNSSLHELALVAPSPPAPTPSPPNNAPPRPAPLSQRPHPSRRPTPSPSVKNRAQTPLRKREPKNLSRAHNQAASAASALGGAPKNGVNLPPPPPPLPDKEAARSGSADDEAEKEGLAISALTAVAQCEHAAAAAAAAASSSSASGACGGGDLKNRVSTVESGGDIGGDAEVAGGTSDKRTQPPMNGKPETRSPKPYALNPEHKPRNPKPKL